MSSNIGIFLCNTKNEYSYADLILYKEEMGPVGYIWLWEVSTHFFQQQNWIKTRIVFHKWFIQIFILKRSESDIWAWNAKNGQRFYAESNVWCKRYILSFNIWKSSFQLRLVDILWVVSPHGMCWLINFSTLSILCRWQEIVGSIRSMRAMSMIS